MRTATKRALMWLYCRGYLSIQATQWLYDRFGLKEY